MDAYYKKLDLDIHDLVKNIRSNEKTWQLGNFSEYLTRVNIQDINQILYDKFALTIFPEKVNLTKISAPGVVVHTDSFNVAINVYINAKSGITKFYEEKHTELEQTVYSSDDVYGQKHNIQNFSKENIVELCSIQTQAGESYLFNTAAPHSVHIPEKDSERHIFRIIWPPTVTYKQVYNNLLGGS